jgi:hypothetical protein
MDWTTPAQPGRYILLARATDAAGHAQPAAHDRRYGSYVVHHVLPIEVIVDDPAMPAR